MRKDDDPPSDPGTHRWVEEGEWTNKIWFILANNTVYIENNHTH